MKKILRRTIILTILLSAVASPRSTSAQQDPSAPPDPITLLTVEQQLTNLTPQDPVAYFNLAETCLDQNQADLATRLFVLAAHLDTARFGRSACLGIAALAETQNDPERARQMHAMARMYPSNENTSTADNTHAITLDENNSPEVSYRHLGAYISGFLGFYRTGFGTRALKTLELEKQTYPILAEFEQALGSIAAILQYCRENVRCELCQNTLFVELPDAHLIRQQNKNDRAPDPHELYQVCPRALSYPPQLSSAQNQHLLNVESALTGATKARWGAQLALNQNKTRPILDPAYLPRMLNINPNHTIYQDGQWQNPTASTTDP